VTDKQGFPAMKKIWLVVGIVLIFLVLVWLMAIPSPPRPKVRGVMPEAAPEAKPPEPAPKRFGAGVIRKSEKPVDED
jgi:hypothetical protein